MQTVDKKTPDHKRSHTKVNICKSLCIYCICCAFVDGVQAETGELRLIK